MKEMENLPLDNGPGRNGTADTEVDDTVWKDLPQHLQEKCLGYLPVLPIASTLRGVNRRWSSYPGTSAFMALHGHGKNIQSSFGFLMFGTNMLTHQCETMALEHNTLKWKPAPSLQLAGLNRACEVEAVSEGLLCLQTYPSTPHEGFIVWNPLLPSSCQQKIPRLSRDTYWKVSLVVDRESASFKILAFTYLFRECHIFSSTTRSWLSHKGPGVHKGLYFSGSRDGGPIAVTYQNCLYVAVRRLFVDDVHQVGDLCYDVNTNVWKSSSVNMISLPPETLELYTYCITRSLFVVSDVMYMVVEYVQCKIDVVPGDAPTVQILARSLVRENNAECKWRVIATTVLPEADWEFNWFGTWYGCILDGHEKPTICGLFKSEPDLMLMRYSIESCKWTTVCVTHEATIPANAIALPDRIGIISCPYGDDFWDYTWTVKGRKWLAMLMVPNYEPSWICPSRECEHQIPD